VKACIMHGRLEVLEGFLFAERVPDDDKKQISFTIIYVHRFGLVYKMMAYLHKVRLPYSS